jgi:cell division cycle 20-like protein 1 (cofactor of APC complex)
MVGHEARVCSLSWNQSVLSSGSKDKQIINHDVRVKNHKISVFRSHLKEVCGLKWSPSGNYLASGGNDNQLFLWDSNSLAHSNPKPLYNMDTHTAAVKVFTQ